MDDEWFRDFVAKASWTFAKTMPLEPHWYTLRRDHDRSEFDRAVVSIREYGYQRIYNDHPYICYDLEGWMYWTMGAPVQQTILINRARIEPD